MAMQYHQVLRHCRNDRRVPEVPRPQLIPNRRLIRCSFCRSSSQRAVTTLQAFKAAEPCSSSGSTTTTTTSSSSSSSDNSVSKVTFHHSPVGDPSQVIQGTPLRAAHLLPHYDAVVIGSGISGLSAATSLAKFGGKKVLVLEQHYTAGGFTHAFRRGKYAWNVGVHYVGGGIGEPGGEMFPIFNALTDGAVSWAALPDVYSRVVIADRQYDYVRGEDAWLQTMTGYFPGEKKALEQVLRMTHQVKTNLRGLSLAKVLPEPLSTISRPWTVWPAAAFGRKTTLEVLRQITQNQELIAVLAGQWADIGLPPGKSSAAIGLGLIQHYMEGAFVPEGGGSSIAGAMIRPIQAAGGEVVTSADVTQILVRGGRACGVRLASGQEIMADQVISTAGVVNTYASLLPQEVANAHPEIQDELSLAKAVGSSLSCINLYVGVDEPWLPEFEGLGVIHKHGSADLDGNFERSLNDMTAPFADVFVACCEGAVPGVAASEQASGQGTKHSGAAEPGVSTLQVVAAAPYNWFSEWSGSSWHHRGDDYQVVKQQLTERLMGELGALFPSLPSRAAYVELSTPLSSEHFSRWGDGAIYGLSASVERFRVHGGYGFGPRTSLPGLMLSGQDILSAGVAGAMMSGVLCSVGAGGLGLTAALGRALRQWQ